MDMLITILSLGFVIFIHEMGHLLFAKWGGIGVFEFSVGMGPKVCGFNYKDTQYNLRALPFGGFVKLAGLDPTQKAVDESVYFQNRPMIHRFSTILAGSMMNVVLGFVMFFILIFMSGVTQPIIKSIVSDTPAFDVGLQPGDRLMAIDGVAIEDVRKDFVQKIQNNGVNYNLTISRGDYVTDVLIQPYFDAEYQLYRLGILLDVERFSIASLSNALVKGVQLTGMSIAMVFKSVAMLFDGTASINDLSGPVGIVQMASFQLSENVASFFNLIAFISITLGVMNLLPIPVLDGGHLVLLIYEALFKRPVPAKFVQVVNGLFVVCLIGIMAFVLVNDILQWTNRVDLLQGLNSK